MCFKIFSIEIGNDDNRKYNWFIGDYGEIFKGRNLDYKLRFC